MKNTSIQHLAKLAALLVCLCTLGHAVVVAVCFDFNKQIGSFEWPQINKLLLIDNDLELPIQIKGKLVTTISTQKGYKESEIMKRVYQLDKIKSRKDPKQADKDACMKLVESDLFYKSFCPCCDQKTETFQIDHFYDSSKNHLSEIWPVCKPCNQTLGVGGDLKDGSFRKEKERNFMAFQQILQNQNRPKSIQKSLF